MNHTASDHTRIHATDSLLVENVVDSFEHANLSRTRGVHVINMFAQESALLMTRPILHRRSVVPLLVFQRQLFFERAETGNLWCFSFFCGDGLWGKQIQNTSSLGTIVTAASPYFFNPFPPLGFLVYE